MKETKPILYEYTVCPFCQKIKAILMYKQIPFDKVEVNPMNKKEILFSKDYKKVPIFIDKDGRQINDSTLIMRHIDQQYPNRPVFETDPVKIAEENKWLQWSDETFVKALPPLIYDTFSNAIKAFGYITQHGKYSYFQRLSIHYFGAFIMWRVAKKSAKKQQISDPKQHFINVLDHLAKGLSTCSYLGGNKPNGADLALFGILASIRDLPAFSLVKENNAVYTWFTELAQ